MEARHYKDERKKLMSNPSFAELKSGGKFSHRAKLERGNKERPSPDSIAEEYEKRHGKNWRKKK